MSVRTRSDARGVSGPAGAPLPGGSPGRGDAAGQGSLVAGETGRAGAAFVLVAAASLPLARPFLGWEAVRPAVGAALVAIALAWGARRLGAGRGGALVVSALGWVAFTTAVFAPGTGRLRIVPTFETLEVVREVVTAGIVHAQQHAAPVEPHLGLLALVVAGTWAVATIVQDALVARDAPLRALLAALVLATAPAAAAADSPGAAEAARWIGPFLAAAVLVLLVSGRTELHRWGQGHAPPAVTTRSTMTAVLVGGLAIVTAVPVASALPGFGEPPLYQLTGGTRASVTTNPMVDLQPSLTSPDTGTVLEVTTPRPVYLRTTALEVYEDGEVWTAPDRTVGGSPIPDGQVPRDVEAPGEDVSVEVGVVGDLDRLVPVPYPPTEVGGEPAAGFLFDPRSGTVTLDRDTTLEEGDRYDVEAVLPSPDPDRLAEAEGYDPDGQLTELPDDVPAAATELAERIVADAGASTPLEQALAIQDELQSWEYSLEPPYGAGHDGGALAAFLDTRVGYCEQYAGAMAVMLRSLDVPARVAVGFTSGTLVDPAEHRWEITNENAHAWVEVLFPGAGWVPFEPTPRSDGNVLVPDQADLSPADTVAGDLAAAEADADPDAPDAPEIEDFAEFEQDPSVPEEALAGGGAGGTGGDDGPSRVWLAAGAVAALLLGLGLWRGRVRTDRSAPARVLAARRRVERVAAGRGVLPAGNETDREYLARVAAVEDRAAAAAGALASATQAVRFADAVPTGAAGEAERAAAQVVRLLAPGWIQRAALTVGGAWRRLLRWGRARSSPAEASPSGRVGPIGQA